MGDECIVCNVIVLEDEDAVCCDNWGNGSIINALADQGHLIQKYQINHHGFVAIIARKNMVKQMKLTFRK